MPELFAAYVRAFLGTHLPAAKSDRGATATEYAILVAFIAVLLIAAAIFLREGIASIFTKAGSSLKAQ
jgi:Flp pilus assembly pilin Flp